MNWIKSVVFYAVEDRVPRPSLWVNEPGVSLETIGFDEDHVHMIMLIAPTYAVSEVMGRLKCQLASGLRAKFSCLAQVY